MGEIAEDIIDGTQCDSCGCYFKNDEADAKRTPEQVKTNTCIAYSHGYPATCHDCWNHMSKSVRKHHVRAIVGTH